MANRSEQSLYAAYCHLYGEDLTLEQARGNQRWTDLAEALHCADRHGSEDNGLQLAACRQELERLSLPDELRFETGADSYQELYLRYRRRYQQLNATLSSLNKQLATNQAAVEQILRQSGPRPALGKAKPALKPVRAEGSEKH